MTLQEVAEGNATLQNITEGNSWTWTIPRTGIWAAAVSAANSKGSSLPTRINIADLCGAGKYHLTFNTACGKLYLINLLFLSDLARGLK